MAFWADRFIFLHFPHLFLNSCLSSPLVIQCVGAIGGSAPHWIPIRRLWSQTSAACLCLRYIRTLLPSFQFVLPSIVLTHSHSHISGVLSHFSLRALCGVGLLLAHSGRASWRKHFSRAGLCCRYLFYRFFLSLLSYYVPGITSSSQLLHLLSLVPS